MREAEHEPGPSAAEAESPESTRAGQVIAGSSKVKNKQILNTQDKYRDAQYDVQQLLKKDLTNKGGISEQKLIKERHEKGSGAAGCGSWWRREEAQGN